MKAYLKALNLWEVIEDGVNPTPLGPDLTLAQIKNFEEQKAKKPRVLICLHWGLSKTIFTRIMACETPKQAWDKLKEEFEGSDRMKIVKLLTLKRELLGDEFPNFKVVEKILISLPTRFEPKVSAIEESCDLRTLSVAELINKGKAIIREGRTSEFPPCNFCKKPNHLEKDCWTKDKSKVQCRFCKKFGQFEQFFKAKQNQTKNQNQQQNQQKPNYTNEHEENETENVFVASQVTRDASQETWYIDSAYTSHMAKEESMFNKLDRSINTKVKLGNGQIL
ncbi:uncharacterized protein LOC105632416 [Jatropha curcas]|uniref:uncharacterized protein LOC105632416 n=1 Tax=Jatropha curcas TaxID=180498 RepID=UPI0005FB8DE6|nr:uncharacterized protein LOC105632416 [Jatropha curcas]